MNRAHLLSMNNSRRLCSFGLGLTLTIAFLSPATAAEKPGMPDLAQIEQTCLPTSTANLIVWFGLHGYPKLIVNGDSKEDGFIHTVHKIMAATDARFDWGTRPDKIEDGIKQYITDCGYSCDVEFRGLGHGAFTPDWLKENDQPNEGFVLLLGYVSYDRNGDTFRNAWDAGHAVTLVNAEPTMLLIHDPAHDEGEAGRKILTPEVLTHGTWVSRSGNAPVAGLMLLSGSLLDTPPNAGVLLIGAVSVKMHPPQDMIAASKPSAGGTPPAPNIGSGGDPTPATTTPAAAPAAAPASATKSWAEWIFELLFSK